MRRAEDRAGNKKPPRGEAVGLSVEPVNEIGAAGFEPTTPTTPKWCATKLRYAPLEGSYHSAFPVLLNRVERFSRRSVNSLRESLL